MLETTNRALADAVRFLVIDAVHKAGSGHPGTPLGAADFATTLFTQFMKYDAAHPTWPDRDRFVLSIGHASILLYALMYLTGNPKMTQDELKTFRTFGSQAPGHPLWDPETGVEMTTGALGQGIATAVGMAMAERLMNARFGDDLVDHRTYCFMGDGCIMEGVALEALAIAGHYRLNKLIAVWDDNKIINDGDTNTSRSEDLPGIFRASGWNVVGPVDGHDAQACALALQDAVRCSDRPTVIHLETTIGKGGPREGLHSVHAGTFNADEVAAVRQANDWNHPAFEVPETILDAWRTAGARGATEREAWEKRLASRPVAERAEFERLMAGRLPEGWEAPLEDFVRRMAEEGPTQPVMNSVGQALGAVASTLPELVATSADVASHTGVTHAKLPSVSANDFSGRYIAAGAREHGMGALVNGIALHGGFVPYGTTFLMFMTYMLHAVRNAAHMGIPALFGFGADSIGHGANGPTHQPVAMLPVLRAIPNLWTLRPADAVEAAECCLVALARKSGPSVLIFSQQPVPPVRTAPWNGNLCARGAYVLADAEGGPRQVTLMATGSEVQVALGARDLLQDDGIPTAVVSFPCWELFEEQDDAYKALVLGAEDGVRVSVEASVKFGWERWLGRCGDHVGMTGYGASDVPAVLFERFGITPAGVAGKARDLLGAS